MNVNDIKSLLASISQTLAAIKDFPVFEEVVEDGSYYTMSDLTLADAIQALDEVVQGIENANHSDEFSDLYLTTDLKEAIASLSELGMSIVHADKQTALVENKG
jgi:hypothetical protein